MVVGHRTLSASVNELSIEDGQTPPPVVGKIGEFHLRFLEVSGGDDDATVVTFQARAEPCGDGSPRMRTNSEGGTARDLLPEWETMLHGDGWSALWSAARPVFGEVELTGCLIGDIGDGPLGHVRGRVLRIRVVTETAEATGPDQSGWHRVPSAQRLHDVEIAPRWSLVAGHNRPRRRGFTSPECWLISISTMSRRCRCGRRSSPAPWPPTEATSGSPTGTCLCSCASVIERGSPARRCRWMLVDRSRRHLPLRPGGECGASGHRRVLRPRWRRRHVGRTGHS